MAPRISILLPTHNRADVIGFAIQSILWQSEQDFELLIVGDGCTDQTAEIVAGFNDARIRWFDLPKAPLSGYANRNIALRQAQGHYVAYAQHDDVCLPDHLSRLVATVEAAGAEWCYSRPTWVIPNGLVVPLPINLTNRDELGYFLKVRNHIPSCCVLHSRSSLERVGFWPESVPLAADWTCWRRIIASSAQPVAYCPAATVFHFRANWKQADNAEPLIVRRLAHLADSAHWWPPILKPSIPPGSSEQEFFFAAIKSGGQAYCEALRTGISHVLDRLTWNSLFARRPQRASEGTPGREN